MSQKNETLLLLSPVHTGDIVADFGDYSRRKRRQFVAEFDNSPRIRRLLPKTATLAEFGDCSRQCGQDFRNMGDILK